MKTLEDLYEEVLASDELKEEAVAAASSGGLAEFAAAHGVEASDADLAAFLSGLGSQASDRELSLEELENVAGGKCNRATPGEACASVFTVGVVCGITAVYSAVKGHVGQKADDEGRLCNIREG